MATLTVVHDPASSRSPQMLAIAYSQGCRSVEEMLFVRLIDDMKGVDLKHGQNEVRFPKVVDEHGNVRLNYTGLFCGWWNDQQGRFFLGMMNGDVLELPTRW